MRNLTLMHVHGCSKVYDGQSVIATFQHQRDAELFVAAVRHMQGETTLVKGQWK